MAVAVLASVVVVISAATVFAPGGSTGITGERVTGTVREISTTSVAYDLVTTLNEKISSLRLGATESSRVFGYTFLAAYTAAQAAKASGGELDPEIAAASAGSKTAAALFTNVKVADDFYALGSRHRIESDPESAALGERIAAVVAKMADNDVYRNGTGDWQQKPSVGPFDYVLTGRGEPPLETTWGDQPTIVKASAACELPSPDLAKIESEAKELYASFTKTTALGNDVFWWLAGNGTATPAGQWMRMAMNAAQDAALAPDAALEMLARAAVSAADAGVVGWREKYRHNLLRPESLWKRLYGDAAHELPRETPNHPSYPSGHSFFGGAVSTTIEDSLGEVSLRDNLPADLYAPAEARAWPSIEAALLEASMSRVHAGFHYPSDVIAGQELGTCVAGAVSAGLGTLADSIADEAR